MTPDELAKYILVMREHNVTAFRTADIAIELGPAPAGPTPNTPNPLPRGKTDYEKLLFAATEGFAEEDE